MRLDHDHDRIEIDSSLGLLNTRRNETITHQILSDALYRLNAPICPHLTTRSVFFHGAQYTAECSLPRTSEAYEELPCGQTHTSFATCLRRKCVTWTNCHVKGCITRYGFRRLTPYLDDLEVVIFQTSRHLLEGPLHSSWGTQIGRNEAAKSQLSVKNQCQEPSWACQGNHCASRYEGLVTCES